MPVFLLAEVMKASQQAIERGVKDCLFVDYKRRSGHFDVTTVASIKEITEKVRRGRLARSHSTFVSSFSRRVVAIDRETLKKNPLLVLLQGCHCLLDIAPHAIERLHSVHIYPIVVFVRYKNAKQIK